MEMTALYGRDKTSTDDDNIMNYSELTEPCTVPCKKCGSLDSIVAVWNTNYNKTYAANSGGAATYSHSVLDRINDHMAQMQAVVSRGSYISGHNLSFFEFFFLNFPPKYPVK